MIAETIIAVQKQDWYGGGYYVEIAKGKNQLVTSWSGIKEKIKRLKLAKNGN